jgi:hypothetical protein
MRRSYLLASAVIASAASASSAATLFEENFDADHSANWTVNKSGFNDANTGADFFFNYADLGIPSASGDGGSTRGLMLYANRGGDANPAVAPGVSVSPTGKTFPSEYSLKFKLWQNFNGPLPGGGAGSTQATGAGIGTAGTSAQWQAGTHDSVHFAMVGEGGTTVDVRAYSPAQSQSNTGTGYADASGVFAAGTAAGVRTSADPYYATFLLGGNSAPAVQGPNQTGTTAAGTPGFAWNDVEIRVIDNQAKWFMNQALVATVNLAGLTLGGSNILFNHYDINVGISAEADFRHLIFGLVDNVTVESLGIINVPGDADGDGDADLDDIGIWATNFTGSLAPGSGTGTLGTGDFDGDKDVDLDDQGIWASNFTGSLAPGGVATAALAAVPEPASLSLLALGAIATLARRRRA